MNAKEPLNFRQEVRRSLDKFIGRVTFLGFLMVAVALFHFLGWWGVVLAVGFYLILLGQLMHSYLDREEKED